MQEKIFATKSWLPPKQEYISYLDKIWDTNILTNQGPLVRELEEKLKDFLDIEHLHFVTNGTIAIQIALNVLDIDGAEVITTPFSYVATASSIIWQKCKPVFVDIKRDDFNIDCSKIEAAITSKTKAILPVHVFGYPCDVEEIEKIAKKHNLKVIYDAAHAFGVKYKGKSLISYGDISTCSFHATKLFHTIEGGLCVSNNKEIDSKLDLAKRFGHNGDVHIQLGINAKQSEFHAAMGLVNLNYIGYIIEKRKAICDFYDKLLQGHVIIPTRQKDVEYNYAYYPIVLKDNKQSEVVLKALEKESIFPRRYFYPSLNLLPYLNSDEKRNCEVSEDVSVRIICLPLYPDLDLENVNRIAQIIISSLKSHN